jgi:hypothetical protein
MLLTSGEAAVWTEQDDEEIEYGRQYDYTLKNTLIEEYKVRPPKKLAKIWPHWSEGIPTKLRLKVSIDAFSRGNVYHKPVEKYETLELRWNAPHALSVLKNSYSRLPSARRGEWSGVYRIFSPDTTINRCCGKDPTGTLYIGRAGVRGRNWSILRTRIMSIVTGDHHAIRNAHACDVVGRFSRSIPCQWSGRTLVRHGIMKKAISLRQSGLSIGY